jgi:hypothetical protein
MPSLASIIAVTTCLRLVGSGHFMSYDLQRIEMPWRGFTKCGVVARV